MEYFDMLGINNPYYQSVVCQFPYGIVCFVYINPKINNARLNDIIKMLSVYSMKENFVSLIGDFNIQSEFGIDTPRKLMDIFKKLGVKSAVKSTTHNLGGQLDYILIRNDIDSNKYLAGSFKNLYSDHKSLFLRISTDDTAIPAPPPIHLPIPQDTTY